LKSDAARAGILKLFESKSPDNLTVEALRAAGELGGMDLANAILKAWQGYSPALKTAAAEVLVTRGDWAARLLDGVEGKWVASGKINGSDIPVSVRRSFAQNKDLKARAQTLLGAWNESSADVKKLIAAKRKAALTGEPNLETGKIMFTTTCATCHKFHGGGQEVGPELIGNGRSSLDALLSNVIDPNQIIGNGYENFTVTTRDGRTLAGRVIEDTPTQMTLLGIGGVRTVVPRGEIKEAVNSHQSLMPMSFGELPDDVFRDLVWYVLAPPEEGPLTKEKKAALAAPVTAVVAAPAAPAPSSDGVPRGAKVDWESVSLWNPDWKVTAPEFEGTPHKLADYLGRKNVLMMHPFEDRKTPAKLTRELTLPADKPVKLKFATAGHDKGDWQLLVTVNGKEAKRETIGHDGERWKKVEIDLAPWKGQKVSISLENHATDWMYEFSYWSNLRLE
jgi:putative heme-binding domain-containing protein